MADADEIRFPIPWWCSPVLAPRKRPDRGEGARQESKWRSKIWNRHEILRLKVWYAPVSRMLYWLDVPRKSQAATLWVTRTQSLYFEATGHVY